MKELQFIITMPSLAIVLTSLVVTFIGVGLRGFQTKNVQGNHYKLVYGTSWFIIIAEALGISFITQYGLIMILPAGFGASLGMITSMWLHNKWVK